MGWGDLFADEVNGGSFSHDVHQRTWFGGCKAKQGPERAEKPPLIDVFLRG